MAIAGSIIKNHFSVRPSLGWNLLSPEFFSLKATIGNAQDKVQIRNRVRPPLGHSFLSHKLKSWTGNRGGEGVTLMLKASFLMLF